ncbi:protein takeout-like [Battus philenor]|uniref:protein takeout-like n=1 Tax=Battus philenor TaxID=42288 RepID=UPI0035CEC22D
MYFNNILISVIVIYYINITGSESFHGFEKNCSDESPQCLKSFLQSALVKFFDGIPELGINCIDPFEIKNIQFLLPSGLKIEFLEGQATGFKRCIIDSVRKNHTNFEVIAHCNLTIEGSYKSSGNMLMFPVNGDGDSSIKCSKIKIKMNFNYMPIVADGQIYWNIKNVDSTHTYEGQVFYNFTNIFKGNSVLSKIVLDFMNNNWLLVANEFGYPIVNYGVQEIINNIKKLFREVPSDQLILT